VLTREELIDHILKMKTLDQDYARFALAQYNKAMPWMDLNNGVKLALESSK